MTSPATKPAMKPAMKALRWGVAWSQQTVTTTIRVRGDDAHSAVDYLVATDLFLRDGQARPGVLLNEDGSVFSDVYIAQEEDSYLLLAEGPTEGDLLRHIERVAPKGATIENTTGDVDFISIHGPYAWELIGELLGPDFIGLPYLYFYRVDDIFCLRAGKTGEYGYDLIVPKTQTQSLIDKIQSLGAPFGVEQVDQTILDQCALENGFFNARREGSHRLNPIELGLQWRVSSTKDFFGNAAFSALRALGPARRITYFTSVSPVNEKDAVTFADESLTLGQTKQIGEVLAAGYSSVLGLHVGAALLEKPYYHAGINEFMISGAKISTTSPPVINNRSLYINAQRHAYASRERDRFPDIA